MANHKIVVSSIRRLVPSGDDSARFLEGESHEAVTVHFENEDIANLRASHPDFDRHQKLLADFQRAGLPVYANINPNNRSIETLLIPRAGLVAYLARDRSGDVTFNLDSTAKVFVLKSADPNFASYLDILREAQLEQAPVLVTENEDGDEIVDIRRDPNPPPPALVEAVELALAPHPPVVPAVTQERALELFRLVSSQSCDPAALAPLCIPFRYPDDGCHARAHQMSKLIIAAGGHPSKVWNFPSNPQKPLLFNTANAPHHRVPWAFHVAVSLVVETPEDHSRQTIVLDPSTFPANPVSVAQWTSVQGDPNSQVSFTGPSQYLPGRPQSRPHEPENDLLKYEHLLAGRAGKIPFPCPRAD